MPENKEVLIERAEALRNQIESVRSQNLKWGRDNSFWLLGNSLVGTCAAAAAAIISALPDPPKYFTTILIAISAAAFLIPRQRKQAERANSHYAFNDRLQCLLVMLDMETSIPITEEEIRDLAAKYRAAILENGANFANINKTLIPDLGHQHTDSRHANSNT